MGAEEQEKDGGVNPYLQDPDVTLYQGHSLDVLRELPDESVDCACGCGEQIAARDVRGRPRRFKRGHNLRVDHPLHRPGVENWWTGRKHSDDVRAKIKASASRPRPWLRGERNGMAGRTGARNPNWRGGVSPERQRLYANAEYRALLTSVRKRDGLRCTKCADANPPLHVHHVKAWATHPELRFDPDNLVTLCKSCHDAEHRKEV